MIVEARDGVVIGPDAVDTDLGTRIPLLGFHVYIPPTEVNLSEHMASGAVEEVVLTDCPQEYIEQCMYLPRISGNNDVSVLSCENTAVGELTLRFKNQGTSEFNGSLNPLDVVIILFRIAPFDE